ncbi:MAG TPA: 1-(5-phosphoribosyl)-5-[(5-phosphoribosylamino)methylideneamino]imidazole-4-carboxamide isomerase [Myxococcota bacterium]|jgi:phosphoribosylformimino-5-aminoimidazole carboxamide ribotide isomerase|nr:1-(5-phosphoribosyl)-5-[(5-phosphoribosylamino)methylideneamino]imidazole-4-carboxamide isomerase [Myxococcota bacterium]
MAAFELIPAIDLLGGRCVRLVQGDYDAATVYGDDPAAVAARFCAAGIRRLHVVDLDGAKAGRPVNGDALRGILAAAKDVPVQLGGGLRTLAAVEQTLGLGVGRVILGTIALRDPELVRESARRFPGRVAVGIDARAGRVAVEGWTETSELAAHELARRFEDVGVAAIVYTDIARDGMLSGPNLEATAELAAHVAIPVIASGGVGSLDDVRRAAALAARGVAGVIVGRALYTGALELGRALEIAQCS